MHRKCTKTSLTLFRLKEQTDTVRHVYSVDIYTRVVYIILYGISKERMEGKFFLLVGTN